MLSLLLTLLTFLLSLTLASSPPSENNTITSPDSSQQPLTNLASSHCGTRNVFLTGFIPDDPAVLEAGFDGDEVRKGLQADQALIAKAGYNVRFALIGSANKRALEDLRLELGKREYDANVIGYGVRGSRNPDVTFLFTDMVGFFRSETSVPLLFNWSPVSTSRVVERLFPMQGNCTATPGEHLGWAEYP